MGFCQFLSNFEGRVFESTITWYRYRKERGWYVVFTVIRIKKAIKGKDYIGSMRSIQVSMRMRRLNACGHIYYIKLIHKLSREENAALYPTGLTL